MGSGDKTEGGEGWVGRVRSVLSSPEVERRGGREGRREGGAREGYRHWGDFPIALCRMALSSSCVSIFFNIII